MNYLLLIFQFHRSEEYLYSDLRMINMNLIEYKNMDNNKRNIHIYQEWLFYPYQKKKLKYDISLFLDYYYFLCYSQNYL